MLSHIRTDPVTKAYAQGYDRIDWSAGEEPEASPRRVKVLPGGGASCGRHDHDTFSEALACLEGGG